MTRFFFRTKRIRITAQIIKIRWKSSRRAKSAFKTLKFFIKLGDKQLVFVIVRGIRPLFTLIFVIKFEFMQIQRMFRTRFN